MSALRRVIGGLLLLAGLSLLPGCGSSETEDSAYREPEIGKQRRESLQKALKGESEESAAIRNVRESPATGGAGTTEEWLGQQTDREKGSMLFPRWEARRRGVGKYEVLFSYTLMNDNGSITRKGYAWDVDLVTRAVSGPRDMQPSELEPRSVPRSQEYLREIKRDQPALE